MSKGDQYVVAIRGRDEPVLVTADKAGRKLVIDSEKDQGVNWILIHEKTWTDKIVKTSRFSASDVVAIISELKEQP